jgi:hypothetical protein
MYSEIIIVPAVFITMYYLVELLVHRKERLLIIDKLSNNQPVDMENLVKKRTSLFSSIKLGCLLIGLGLGFLTNFIIVNSLDVVRSVGELETACVLIFGGLGLVVAYIVEKACKK